MKKYFILTLAIAGLALVSCQKEKFIENSEAPANEIALKSATISTKSAIDGTAFPTGYGMLVSAYRNKESTGDYATLDDASGNYFEGITFTKGSSSNWVAKTPKYWPLKGKLDFLCIASAGIADATKGVAPTSCTWGESSNVAKKVEAVIPDNSERFDDILYGSANAQTYNSGGNQVVFNHAECAVVFFAKSSESYNSTANTGITITGISLNNPYTSGVLTVANPKAGDNSSAEDISASWAFPAGSAQTSALNARVWDTANTGVINNEDELTNLNLKNTYDDVAALDGTAPIPSATTLNNKFGHAYVILPPQNAVSFTISYTLHNGKEADGTTNLDLNYTYKYTPTTGEKWEMGKKVIYLINFTLHEIEIAPVITDWENDFRNVEI